jgi:hypothetical protein
MVFGFLKRKKENSSIDEDLSLLKSSLDLTNNTTTNQPLEDSTFPLPLNNNNLFNTNQNPLSLNNNFLEHNRNEENNSLNNLNNEQTLTFLKRNESLSNFQHDNNSINHSPNFNNNEREILLKLEVIDSKIEKLESKVDMIYNLLMYNKR